MAPPRRHRTALDLSTLEQELATLKARQAELKQQLKRMRHSGTEVRTLEEKAQALFARGKYYTAQIRAMDPNWSEWAFFNAISPQAPVQRGGRRRKQTEAPGAAEAYEAEPVGRDADEGPEPAESAELPVGAAATDANLAAEPEAPATTTTTKRSTRQRRAASPGPGSE